MASWLRYDSRQIYPAEPISSPFIFTRQIDALPAIVKQVAGRCEVYVDDGVTQGTDILKALALGAKMVTCFTV